MKRPLWRTLAGVGVAQLALSACSSLPYNPHAYLYTSDEAAFGLEETADALDEALAGDRPIVLFVHGRGDEPQKSLRGSGPLARTWVEGEAVRKIEDFGCRVLMFNWDSQRGGFLVFGLRDRDRVLHGLALSSKRFGELITHLRPRLESRPAGAPPVTLLAHSMGTIVLAEYVAANGWPRPLGGGGLFDGVVLTGADADNVPHASWLEQIASTEHVYVTVNPGDSVLKRSTESRAAGAVALGLNPGPDLARGATYVDLHSDPKRAEGFKVHEVFNPAVGADSPSVKRFFSQVLAGERPALAEYADYVGPGRYALRDEKP